ncbi:Protein masquerade [Nymphon striatum]|nr:Protein masquerade [Nymphon striatum]
MLITCVKLNETTNTVEDLKFTEILQNDLNCYIAPSGFLVPNVFNYCLNCWCGNITKTNKNKVVNLIKRAGRVIGLLSTLGDVGIQNTQNGAPPPPPANYQGSPQFVTSNQPVQPVQSGPSPQNATCAADSDTCCLANQSPTETKPDRPTSGPAQAANIPVQTANRPVQTANRPVQTNQRPVQTNQRPVQTNQRPVQTNQRPISNKPSDEVTGEGVASWLGTPVEISPPIKPLILRPVPVRTTTRVTSTTTTTRPPTTRQPTTRRTTTRPPTFRQTTTTTTTPKPTTIRTTTTTKTTPRPTTTATKVNTQPPAQPRCQSINGICITGSIAKYCQNIVNGHCDDGHVCCRNEEKAERITTSRPISFVTASEAPKPEVKLPPCPGTCLVNFFGFLCNDRIPDVYCANDRICCAKSASQTTKPPVKYCKGFCIPKHVNTGGMCNRPARLVADTIECNPDSICCHQGYKETPILRPTESRPSAQKPLFVPSNNLRPDDSYTSIDRFEEDSPSCPGECVVSALGILPVFTCTGDKTVDKRFSCSRNNLVCCAPNTEIKNYEDYLSQKPSYQNQYPRPQNNRPPNNRPQSHHGDYNPLPDTRPPTRPRPRPIPHYISDEVLSPPTHIPVQRPDAAIHIPHYQARPDETFSQLDTSNEYSPVLDTNEEAHQPRPTRPNQRPVVTPSHSHGEPEQYVCGKQGGRRYGRVIGGSDTKPGEWCWQVALINSMNQYLCGGALIGSEWVLTAAHCVTGAVSNGESLYVRVGDHDLASKYSTPGAQTKRVYTTYIHHNHNSQTLDNDIALLKLDGLVDLNDVVCLICLPARGVQQDAGKNCTVTGYGYQHEVGPAALKIREAVLPIGDGGGPMSCLVDQYWELTGIVSWGFGCGRKDVPGVYVKVSSFIGWINQIVSVNKN